MMQCIFLLVAGLAVVCAVNATAQDTEAAADSIRRERYFLPSFEVVSLFDQGLQVRRFAKVKVPAHGSHDFVGAGYGRWGEPAMKLAALLGE